MLPLAGMKTVSCVWSPAKIAALAFLATWLAGPGEGHAQWPGAQFPGGLTCQKVSPILLTALSYSAPLAAQVDLNNRVPCGWIQAMASDVILGSMANTESSPVSVW